MSNVEETREQCARGVRFFVEIPCYEPWKEREGNREGCVRSQQV